MTGRDEWLRFKIEPSAMAENKEGEWFVVDVRTTLRTWARFKRDIKNLYVPQMRDYLRRARPKPGQEREMPKKGMVVAVLVDEKSGIVKMAHTRWVKKA